MQLHPYQAEGARWLAGRKTALLADECGLGKTPQLVRACDHAMALKVLVVCPASVVENWRREIARWREGDWTAFVTSYDRAAGADYARVLGQGWDIAIFDEAHYLKTPTAKRTQVAYGKGLALGIDALAARAAQVWIATATPSPNDPSELFTHLRALYPEAVISTRTGLPWTLFQFQHRYCEMRHTGFGTKVVGSKNEAELHAKLKGFMLRRRKADVLRDLPPLTFGEVFLEGRIDGSMSEEAALIEQMLAEQGVAGLRSISTNGAVATLRRLTGLAKVAPAAAWVNDWLDGAPDRKIVVFAHHKQVIEGLFDKLHTRAVRVDGATKQSERQRAVDRLQADPKVRCFIGQITSAGVGLTLTAASDMLFVESSWVPAEMEQAAQRIHRIGQSEPCVVRFGILAGSIDEQIQRAVARKVASIGRVVDGLS